MKLKRFIPMLLWFIPSFCHAEITKTIFNPFTGKQDYITSLSSSTSVGGSFALTGYTLTSTITATQNNYNPPGLSTSTVLGVRSDAANRQITGLASAPAGTLIELINVGNFYITLTHENTSSSALNRFFFGQGANLTLGPNMSIVLQYNPTNSRWMEFTAGTPAGQASNGDTSLPVLYNRAGQVQGDGGMLYSRGVGVLSLFGIVDNTYGAGANGGIFYTDNNYNSISGSLHNNLANLFYDITLRRLSVNTGSGPTAALDVTSVNNTDIGFRLKQSNVGGDMFENINYANNIMTVIDPYGRVGIGNATPDYALDIYPSALIASTTGGLRVKSYASQTYNTAFADASGNVMDAIDPTGNAGFGTNALDSAYKVAISPDFVTASNPSGAVGSINYYAAPSNANGSITYDPAGFYPTGGYSHTIRVFNYDSPNSITTYDPNYAQSNTVTDDGRTYTIGDPSSVSGTINYSAGSYVANGDTWDLAVTAYWTTPTSVLIYGPTQVIGTAGMDDGSTNIYGIAWSWAAPGGQTPDGYIIQHRVNGGSFDQYQDAGNTTSFNDDGSGWITASPTLTPTSSPQHYYITWSNTPGTTSTGIMQKSDTYHPFSYDHYVDVPNENVSTQDGLGGDLPWIAGNPETNSFYVASGKSHSIAVYSTRLVGSTTIYSSVASTSSAVMDDSSGRAYSIQWIYSIGANSSGARVLKEDDYNPHSFDVYYDTSSVNWMEANNTNPGWASGSNVFPNSVLQGGLKVANGITVTSGVSSFPSDGTEFNTTTLTDPISSSPDVVQIKSNSMVWGFGDQGLNTQGYMSVSNGTIKGFGAGFNNTDGFIMGAFTGHNFTIRGAGNKNVAQFSATGGKCYLSDFGPTVDNATGSPAQLNVYPYNASTKVLMLQTQPSQSADVLDVWNSAGSTLTFINKNGSFYPHKGSASADTAPEYWTSGPLLTTPVTGAKEFLTDKWYGTITTGASRKEFSMNDSALTSGTLPYATTNGRLTDSTLTFTPASPTALTITGGGARYILNVIGPAGTEASDFYFVASGSTMGSVGCTNVTSVAATQPKGLRFGYGTSITYAGGINSTNGNWNIGPSSGTAKFNVSGNCLIGQNVQGTDTAPQDGILSGGLIKSKGGIQATTFGASPLHSDSTGLFFPAKISLSTDVVGNLSSTLLQGTTTNDNASSGFIGEYISSVAASAIPVGTSAQYNNILQVSLSSGDWEVSGLIDFNLNGATLTSWTMALSTNSGNTTTDQTAGDNQMTGFLATAAFDGSASIPVWRVSTATNPTVIYLKVNATFAIATPTVRGRISARRMR